MNEQILQISSRIKELREILEISSETVAQALDISNDEYLKYENGEKDIPISALYKIAAVLGTDFTVLLTGEAPRMSNLTVVRRGKGVNVDRYEGYHFEALAYNYIGRTMEPMLVTLSPGNDAPFVAHGGQEFNFVLSGKVKVTVGSREQILEAGDSIYFDPREPHGQAAVDDEATFLTVIEE